MMKRTMPQKKHLAALFAASTLFACGGSAPPPQTPVDKPVEKPADAAPAEPDKAASGVNAEAAALCIATANATRAKFSGEPAKISVKHILVLHTGSKKNDAGVKRSREEACMRALEVRDKLREGADFDEMVKQYSEEPGAASRNGSIGSVERSMLLKPFADAAFELGLNQMSDVVETEFGFHLVVRTE